VKAIERVFEPKEYDDKKSFKLAILKLKGMLHYGMSTSRRVGLQKSNPKSKLV